MSKRNSIRHWYDGLFYEWFIAPNQRVIFKKMREMIPHFSSILDVATGTGLFVFDSASHASHITGLDLSITNINVAKKKLRKSETSNITFLHGNALQIDEIVEGKFDYATIAFALHEMPESIRADVLSKIKLVANEIIIADYISPMPKSFYGTGVRLIEFFAGVNHYAGYKSYQRSGGLLELLNSVGLTVVEEHRAHYGTSLILRVK